VKHATRAHCWHLKHEDDPSERDLRCCGCAAEVDNEQLESCDSVCPEPSPAPWRIHGEHEPQEVARAHA
jgi:hypothetical protein